MLFVEVDNFVWLLMLQDETSIALNGLVYTITKFIKCIFGMHDFEKRTKSKNKGSNHEATTHC
jgi:hypothetical protein